MHIATAQALAEKVSPFSIDKIGLSLGKKYKACWKLMSGRAPGKTTGKMIKVLNEDGSNWNKIPFRKESNGCGASMRAACIGLCFLNDLEQLIAVSVEAGRITHHNPNGYLGSVASALFACLAFKEVALEWWPLLFLQSKGLIAKYLQQSGREVNFNLKAENFNFFFDKIQSYVKTRNLLPNEEDKVVPKFPDPFGVLERDNFYRGISYSGWGGSSGYDSVIIAYDALLGCKGSWEQLCLRGVLHGGDNDSTGTMCCAWFGALYGFKDIPECNYKFCEDNNLLRTLGGTLLDKYYSEKLK